MHPEPGSSSPSIAGVVASTNRFGTGYTPEFRVQSARREIIEELDQMVKNLVQRFREGVKTLPKVLIFYRDGVSDGQFPTVLKDEVPLVRKGCWLVDRNWNPRLTFIICGKRHHFRFGAPNPNDQDRSGNVKPGLVVDTDIVHPFDFDWYGQSHAGLLGTSRSSHYTVLVDDSKFKADVIQKLTYHLCYLYSRSTRSVSIVPPAYHAHHICTRAKLWLIKADEDTSTVFSGGSSEKAAAEDAALSRYRNQASGLLQVMQSKKRQWNTEFWM